MESGSRTKAFESIYSLRKYKSLAFKFDKNIRKTALMSTCREKALKPSKISSPEIFKSANSLITLSSGKRDISKLYESRILPSQFLSTPVKVLNKLTKKIYTYDSIKDTPKESSETPLYDRRPDLFLTSYKKPELSPRFEDTQKFFDSTCQEILDDNKNSKKKLRIATRYLTKRGKMVNEIIKSIEKSDQKLEFDGFY